MGKAKIQIRKKRRVKSDDVLTQLEQLKKDNELAEQKIWKMLEELGRQIGGVNNSFGKLTENLMLDSLENLMREKFTIQFFDTNTNRSTNGESIEIDAYGIVNGNVNSIYITEVKTKFSTQAIEQLKNTINKFDKFFPEHKGKRKFGILAVPRLTDKQAEQIMAAGFYPVSLKKDLIVLNSPDNFKAKAF